MKSPEEWADETIIGFEQVDTSRVTDFAAAVQDDALAFGREAREALRQHISDLGVERRAIEEERDGLKLILSQTSLVYGKFPDGSWWVQDPRGEQCAVKPEQPKPERYEPCGACCGSGWVAPAAWLDSGKISLTDLPRRAPVASQLGPQDDGLDPDCRAGTCDCSSKPKPTIDQDRIANLQMRVEALEQQVEKLEHPMITVPTTRDAWIPT